MFFVIGDERIPVLIVRPPRRKSGYSIRLAAKGLKISVPKACDNATALGYLEKHRRWIMKKHNAKILAENELPPLKPGGEVPLLGDWRTITPANVATSHFSESEFLFPEQDANDPAAIAMHLTAAYIETAAKSLKRLTENTPSDYKPLLREVRLKDLKSRWGSCSRDGRISISWRVVMAPPYVFQYLFAHEICHLKHHGHDSAFWRAVEALAPNAADAKRYLRANHHSLTQFPCPPMRPVTLAAFIP